MNKKLLTREEILETEIEILKVIDEICNKNNISYFLCAGTLLGAVRHKGFIPWDDDIDITLARSDYDKLIELLKKQKEYDYLTLLDIDSKGYYYPFAKLVDNRTIAKMSDNVTNHGIWVDIFPLDNVPNQNRKRKKFINKCYIYRSIIMSMTTDFSSENLKKRKIKKMLNLATILINKNKFAKKYNKYIQKYNNQKTNYCGFLCSPYKEKDYYEKNIFEKRIQLKFENEMFWCPKEYNQYLTHLYGNYMELPPVEKRRTHGITAWK